ncbi:MAG: BatA domain-containing protein [Bacteroidota bacterium]
MTFLNPFLLFGLVAAAIPILIHLFNIRKLRTIEFSTLTFLKELNRNKIRRIKVRQWLLLILRTLLILLIVLAFSRPALKGSFGSAGSRAATTLVILLDNTASMQLHNEQGTFLSQAQQQAQQVIASMQENDEVFFLRLSDLPQATTEVGTQDRTKISALIKETDVSYNRRTIEEGMRLAARLLQQSKNYNKEVYVITDGQRSTLTLANKSQSAVEQLFEPQVRIFYTQLSNRPGENIAVEKTTVPPSLLQVNKPFTVNVVMKNYGSSPVTNHLVTVTFDRHKVMQKSVSLGGGESTTLEFSITPSRAGVLSGFAESEDDLYEPDNQSFFSVTIPEKISVALIAPEETFERYIAAALAVAKAANPSSPITVTAAPPSRITTSLFSNNDVVILTGVKELTIPQSELLTQFVRNGGGVIFFPAADTSAHYRYLEAFGLAGLRINRSPATFNKTDLQFPIFQGMFEQGLQKKNVTIESPQITATMNAVSETNLRTVIDLTSGKSFLWQRELGRGKVLGFSVPATADWSDLPLKGIFVPLLYQSVLYLAAPVNTGERQEYFAGERIEFSSAGIKRGSSVSPSSLQMIDTENRPIPLESYVRTTAEGVSHSLFTFEHADRAGIYAAKEKNDTVLVLSVNVHREESQCELADNEHVSSMMKRLGVEESALQELPPNADIEQTIAESRFGIELWRYFLLAALLVALAEMIIARETKQNSVATL